MQMPFGLHYLSDLLQKKKTKPKKSNFQWEIPEEMDSLIIF